MQMQAINVSGTNETISSIVLLRTSVWLPRKISVPKVIAAIEPMNLYPVDNPRRIPCNYFSADIL